MLDTTDVEKKGCEFKAKRSGTLKTHLSKAHNVGQSVVWHLCGEEGCFYKAKQAGNLRSHKASVHSKSVNLQKLIRATSEIAKRERKLRI